MTDGSAGPAPSMLLSDRQAAPAHRLRFPHIATKRETGPAGAQRSLVVVEAAGGAPCFALPFADRTFPKRLLQPPGHTARHGNPITPTGAIAGSSIILATSLNCNGR